MTALSRGTKMTFIRRYLVVTVLQLRIVRNRPALTTRP